MQLLLHEKNLAIDGRTVGLRYEWRSRQQDREDLLCLEVPKERVLGDLIVGESWDLVDN
jgi:hypothetical protein